MTGRLLTIERKYIQMMGFNDVDEMKNVCVEMKKIEKCKKTKNYTKFIYGKLCLVMREKSFDFSSFFYELLKK